MLKNIFQNSFIEFCKKKNFEINDNQIEIIKLLNNFINHKKGIFNFLSSSKDKLCFYLHGNIGVGKTMLANYFYDGIKLKKNNNSIQSFVKDLKKKYELIYLDEFQVTNIVDAMILGKLFETIFQEKIKVIITTNTKLNDLYRDGLQREQFLPFISIINKHSIEKELSLYDDYRMQDNSRIERIFYPLNEKTLFKINKNFRELTRDIKKETKVLTTKGRNFEVKNFFNGVTRFRFNDLCDVNLGAEDYINIAKICNHIFIEEIPVFDETNSNQQLRFITLIDILYEKKINLTLSLAKELKDIGSSLMHKDPFKRTISRLFEMVKI